MGTEAVVLSTANVQNQGSPTRGTPLELPPEAGIGERQGGERSPSPHPSAAANLELPGGRTPVQEFRFQQLQASFSSVEVVARRTELAGSVLRTASVVASRAVADVRISSLVLERFGGAVAALSEHDPRVLEEFLLLIELLDQRTPEQFDAFFDKVRDIVRGAEAGGTEFERVVRSLRAFYIEVSVSVTSVEISFQSQAVNKADPLVLDLDGDGVELTSARDGRSFDIDADGSADRTAFVTGGDAFLALDRDGNGRIDDGSELFGEHHGAADGLAELVRFDSNSDGVINETDSVFRRLGLWDGQTLRPLDQAGISSLGLTAVPTGGASVAGNELVSASAFTRRDGTTGLMADALLGYY